MRLTKIPYDKFMTLTGTQNQSLEYPLTHRYQYYCPAQKWKHQQENMSMIKFVIGIFSI